MISEKKNLFNTYLNEGMRDVTTFASIGFNVLLVIIFYIAGLTQLANAIVFGVVLVYVVAILIRSVYFKQRPNSVFYHNWLEKIDAGSFPSVHSARIFLLVTILSYPYTDYLMTIFLFLLAIFVGYSRVYLKKHYWSDVLAGMIFGTIIGAILAYAML